MGEIRNLIQTKLTEILNLDCGVPVPDGVIVEGKTYFGYELQETYLGSDFNKNYTMEITLTGRLVRKELENEDTLSIMDNTLSELISKLKELNFKCSYNDISFQDGIRKFLVKANVKYNELNKTFII